MEARPAGRGPPANRRPLATRQGHDGTALPVAARPSHPDLSAGGCHDLAQANQLLAKEVHDDHYRRVHSTTGPIPALRFQQVLKANQSLFRSFTLPPPFQSAKDLFCFRVQRTTNASRWVSLDPLQFSVRGVAPHQPVTLRIAPRNPQLAEVRFWHDHRLVDIQTVKTADLKGVSF